jgi:hypothetical protein
VEMLGGYYSAVVQGTKPYRVSVSTRNFKQGVGAHENGTKSNHGGSFDGTRWRVGSQIRDNGFPQQLILGLEDARRLFFTSIRPPVAGDKTPV